MTTRPGIKLGYQMPNFTYDTSVADLFPTVVSQAREAESAGFDTVFVMDHFYQLPGIGKPDDPMLEAYSALSALATATETVKLSALVTGNTYRNPAMLAKTVTTLDVVSGGRAVLGIGAGWYELEHTQYGYEFGTFTDRFERLNEALQIIDPMLRGERPSFDGKWYHVENAINEPRVRDDLPILIGGSGEKKTFGLAARFASHLNIICSEHELPRKLDALAQRLDEVGRDASTLETSYLAFVMIDEDGDEARRQQHDYMLKMGTDLSNLSEEDRAAATVRQFVGDPDDVAEQLRTKVLDPGVDGLVINLITGGHVPGVVDLAGKTLTALLDG